MVLTTSRYRYSISAMTTNPLLPGTLALPLDVPDTADQPCLKVFGGVEVAPRVYTATVSTPRGHKSYTIAERQAGGHAHVARRAFAAMAAQDARCSVLDVEVGRLRLA